MEPARIRPLQHVRSDGSVYTRRPEIERLLGQLACLHPSDLITRSAIDDRNHSDFIPDECILYFVRERRQESDNAEFEYLYKVLLRRVQEYLGPADESTDGKVAQRVFDKIATALVEDRQSGYLPKLDYAEVNFLSFLKCRKIEAQRAAMREKSCALDLEAGEDGKPSAADHAIGIFDPFDSKKIEQEDYRSALHAAIDQLSPLQQRIITLKLRGFPFDSIDPHVDTIAKLTRRSDKTVRTYHAAACAALRQKLEKGGVS